MPRTKWSLGSSMITLTLGGDHRVVAGARGAQFLDDLANLIEEPRGLLA